MANTHYLSACIVLKTAIGVCDMCTVANQIALYNYVIELYLICSAFVSNSKAHVIARLHFIYSLLPLSNFKDDKTRCKENRRSVARCQVNSQMFDWCWSIMLLVITCSFNWANRIKIKATYWLMYACICRSTYERQSFLNPWRLTITELVIF